jgi:hypothetical protein
MSRSGYSDDYDDLWAHIRWRGAVSSAIRGKRGQAILRELVVALDALPEKCLAADSLETADGEYCALGAIGKLRGMDMTHIDSEAREAVAQAFSVADALAAEIMFQNDEWITPSRFKLMDGERRWAHMREWALKNIKHELVKA